MAVRACTGMRTTALLDLLESLPEDVKRKIWLAYDNKASIRRRLMHVELKAHVQRRAEWTGCERHASDRMRADVSGTLFAYKVPCQQCQLFAASRVRVRALNTSNLLWGPVVVRSRRKHETTEVYWARMRWFFNTDPRAHRQISVRWYRNRERNVTLLVPSDTLRKCGLWMDDGDGELWQ